MIFSPKLRIQDFPEPASDRKFVEERRIKGTPDARIFTLQARTAPFDKFCSAISATSLPSSVRCTGPSAQERLVGAILSSLLPADVLLACASVSTIRAGHRKSVVCPASRPGICRHELVREQSRPERPALTRCSPKLCPSIATISASAGGLYEAEGNAFCNHPRQTRPAACTSRPATHTIRCSEKVRRCTTTAGDILFQRNLQHFCIRAACCEGISSTRKPEFFA